MAGKKKGKEKKGRKEEKKLVDEYQLRRDLRAQRKLEAEFEEEKVTMAQETTGSQSAAEIRLGGIEGGGTHSTLVIVDGSGKKLTELKGPDTNHWSLGITETTARINAMIEEGKKSLNIPQSIPLDCVGLSLSGCEQEESNNLLSKMLREKYPNAAKDYLVSSDTLGSFRTALDKGGIVLIAGTGSNALLINPDGKIHGCGGWGYVLGDEGSGYWIAHRALKYLFNDMDGLFDSPEPISYVWSAMKNYFKVTDRNDMLYHLYEKFDKSNIANFTKEIVAGCEKGDALCLLLLQENGELLARHVAALARKAHNDLKLASGGLKVICVGSIWKSWNFMKDGFVNELHKSSCVEELSLLRLKVSAALGACYLAAEKINYPIEKSYANNAETFFHYKRDNYVKQKV